MTRSVISASGLIGEFDAAGVLAPADVHVATTLGRLGGEADPEVLLAAALAVRAPRLGHVCVHLGSIHRTASADVEGGLDVAMLPWPGEGWRDRVATSALVGPDGPLHLDGDDLYLDRYWTDEHTVATDLVARAALTSVEVDASRLAAGLARLFEPGDQRLAAATAVLRPLSVIAGGPGTGKTTTVARVLALLAEQAVGRLPLVGLAAPTGKAAARLQEAVHQEATAMETDAITRTYLLSLRGATLHRLLGWTPNRTRFRHHRLNRLPHDVVVVDETSMVSLSLMARLVEAVRPDARLILVGDPEQLASVEAGAVLGDLVGPATRGPRMSAAARTAVESVIGESVIGGPVPDEGVASAPIGDGIVVLRRVHRFGGAIARLADAIQAGDAGAALSVLGDGGDGVQWLASAEERQQVRAIAVATGGALVEHAAAGRVRGALHALSGFRVLCAHRLGPDGVLRWTRDIEEWLGITASEEWYAGRPVLVTQNDYALGLFNGDIGVVVSGPGGRLVAAFDRGRDIVEVSPARLAAIDSVYAMTVHKAQGSQFATVVVVLPAPDSPILTRQLLYTAVTRAQEKVIVVGSAESVVAAVERPIARSSGLGRRLWGGAEGG